MIPGCDKWMAISAHTDASTSSRPWLTASMTSTHTYMLPNPPHSKGEKLPSVPLQDRIFLAFFTPN